MRRLCTILVVLFLLIWTSCDTPIPPSDTSPPTTLPSIEGELAVHFIDVGQGDAILIDLGETEVLIDGGDKVSGVVSYLENY
ncbi:MAG: MBL fold metallo-hydrolase, partial [Candidatus Hodarchaeota archaeon]